MLHNIVKGCLINSPNYNPISKHGRISHIDVTNQQFFIQNHHKYGNTSSRSLHNQIFRTRITFANKDAGNHIIPQCKLSDDHRRDVKRQSLPFTVQHDSTDDDHDYHFPSFFDDLSQQLNVLYRFSRPHTVIGTLIGVTSVSLLPIESLADISPGFFLGLVKALVPSILMNIYVVGLNQLFDLHIDKVNKPDLPLASGEITMENGSKIVSISCLLSFAMGVTSQSPPLVMALLTSFFLGSAYSVDLPMLRWKKQALLAAASIVIVRAVVVQLAFFIHIQRYVLGRPIMLSRSVICATAFMCFFATVIALFKDIPDVDGDKHFGIQSFTVRLGKEKVFWLCIKMLLAAYGPALALGASSPSLPSKLIIVLGHSMLALTLWFRAQHVDLADKSSVTSFYMFIWKLFYAEYLLIPFLR